MQLKTGLRLRSDVCDTEVIVIRTPATDVDLRCGGHPMKGHDEDRGTGEPEVGFNGGSVLGKRYADDEQGLEVLVTKAGAGALSVGSAKMALKEPKRLPTSD